MLVYPIRIPGNSYRGTDARKLRKRRMFNNLAERLERYVNLEYEKRGGGRQMFTYASIASELHLTTDQVRGVFMPIDGGHNGLTVIKEQL